MELRPTRSARAPRDYHRPVALAGHYDSSGVARVLGFTPIVCLRSFQGGAQVSPVVAAACSNWAPRRGGMDDESLSSPRRLARVASALRSKPIVNVRSASRVTPRRLVIHACKVTPWLDADAPSYAEEG